MDSARDVDPADQVNGASQLNPRKRPAPSPAEDEDEEVDRLLPAAAAMKRRRIEEEKNCIIDENSQATPQASDKINKNRKPKQEINIKDVVRERRKAEEEAAQRDEENLRETLDGMNVEEMKNLAVVEEMEIPDRANRKHGRSTNGESNDRWDERWNGRKNFKKFRRRGDGTVARRGATLIVPLEEVKTKDYGIGEDYWLENERMKKQRKEKERTTQSYSQTQPSATARSQAAEVPSELAIDGDLPDAIDLEAPRMTRHHEKTQQSDETLKAGRSQAAGRRRAAVDQTSETQPIKRKKFAVRDSDSDSEDELKFRFRRRN